MQAEEHLTDSMAVVSDKEGTPFHHYGTAPQQQPPSIYPLSSIYMLIMSLWLLIGAPQCARHSRTQEFFK